jgi:hypothetical protein
MFFIWYFGFFVMITIWLFVVHVGFWLFRVIFLCFSYWKRVHPFLITVCPVWAHISRLFDLFRYWNFW